MTTALMVDPVSVSAYAAFPLELDRDWPARVSHLTEADLALIRCRADPVTQLGYATQPATARGDRHLPGRPQRRP